MAYKLFPGGSDGKESACHAGALGSSPGSGRSLGEGHGNPLQDSCLENPRGQRSLVDYSPWSWNEPDMAERLKRNKNPIVMISRGVLLLT